jgi:hypothetical protein
VATVMAPLILVTIVVLVVIVVMLVVAVVHMVLVIVLGKAVSGASSPTAAPVRVVATAQMAGDSSRSCSLCNLLISRALGAILI